MMLNRSLLVETKSIQATKMGNAMLNFSPSILLVMNWRIGAPSTKPKSFPILMGCNHRASVTLYLIVMLSKM